MNRRLADFIRTEMEPILQAWEEFAKPSLAPSMARDITAGACLLLFFSWILMVSRASTIPSTMKRGTVYSLRWQCA